MKGIEDIRISEQPVPCYVKGKRVGGWAPDVAAQSGRKAIILYNIVVQCMGQPVLSQPPQVRQSVFSLIRKDKKNYLIISFLGRLVLWTADVITRRRLKRSENEAFFNCLNFKIHRDFPNLLTLSNVVELSWS